MPTCSLSSLGKMETVAPWPWSSQPTGTSLSGTTRTPSTFLTCWAWATSANWGSGMTTKVATSWDQGGKESLGQCSLVPPHSMSRLCSRQWEGGSAMIASFGCTIDYRPGILRRLLYLWLSSFCFLLGILMIPYFCNTREWILLNSGTKVKKKKTQIQLEQM